MRDQYFSLRVQEDEKFQVRCQTKKPMSIHNLVAHYLKEKNLHHTLRKFEEEVGVPISSDVDDLPTKESLEEIVNDRSNFKQLTDGVSDKLHIDEILDDELREISDKQLVPWSTPYPQNSESAIGNQIINGLVISSEIFCDDMLLLGSADNKFYMIDLKTKRIVKEETNLIGRVVIKKIVSIENSNKVILVGMDGNIWIFEIQNDEISPITNLKTHQKLISDVKYISVQERNYIVSMGWDFMIKVTELTKNQLVPVAQYKLPIQGSCIDVTNYQDKLVIIIGKNDYTFLEVYTLEEAEIVPVYKISLNDAEFLSSIFSPRCIKVFSHQYPLIAVGTSHEPYMRLIVVSLKEFPKITPSKNMTTKRNQILKNLSTMSPQDKYSTAMIEWRQDGSGVWVIGEDGVIRGVDLVSHQVIAELKAHQGRIKSYVSGNQHAREVIVTCGTDRKVRVWNC